MRTHCVILADVVASRSIDEFRSIRDDRLTRLSTDHRGRGLVATDYAVTSWDEFQNVVDRPAHLPRVIWDLRCAFHPLSLWIGVGFGTIEEMPRNGEPLNVGATGEAFERARQAMDHLKDRGAAKYPLLTAFAGADPLPVEMLEVAYRLHDTLIRKITDRQWETILVQRETQSSTETARRLEIDESTVSRNLRRGSWWQIQDTLDRLPKILEKLYK